MIAEAVPGDILQPVVHPFRVIDGAVGQGGGHGLDGAGQGLHRLGPLDRLTLQRRRAGTPAPAGADLPPARLGGALRLLAREQGVEPVEQVAAVLFGQILVLDGRGRLTQAPLQPGLALGRVQWFGLGLSPEQDLDEGPGVAQRLSQGWSPLVAQDVVRVLPPIQQGEAERAAGFQQRQ